MKHINKFNSVEDTLACPVANYIQIVAETKNIKLKENTTTKTTFSAYNKMEAYAYMEEHYKHLKYEKIDD